MQHVVRSESAKRSSAKESGHPVAEAGLESREEHFQAYVWGFRIFSSLLALGGMTAVLLSPGEGSVHYLIVVLAFVVPLTNGMVLAALTRMMHIWLERRLRARLHVRNIQLSDMAMRDDLTQLFNRRYFYDRLQRDLEDARSFQRPLGVVMLDVDCLKHINDTYGHKVGDAVLAAAGKLLRQHTRGCDVPARIGGDEFAVILPEADKRGAQAAARRIKAAVDAGVVCEDHGVSIHLCLSLGISGFPWGGDDVDAVMRSADASLYAAKEATRNTRAELPDPVTI
jgi:diguanylate cyclase (GGDEF)-like protein